MKYKVLANTLVSMSIEAEDYGEAKKKMEEVFGMMNPYAVIDVRSFNIEEAEEVVDG